MGSQHSTQGQDLLDLALAGAPRHVLLDKVAAAAQLLSPGEARSAVLMHDRRRGRLQLEASAGLDEEYRAVVEAIPVRADNPSCARAVATGEEVLVEDVAGDPDWAPYLDVARRNGIRSVWSFPIKGSTDVIGTIALYHGTPRLPTAMESDALRYLASVAATVLEPAWNDTAPPGLADQPAVPLPSPSPSPSAGR